MENSHKQSSYTQSCRHRAPAKSQSSSPDLEFERQLQKHYKSHNHHHHHHRRRRMRSSSSSALGHDHDSFGVQGDFDRELGHSRFGYNHRETKGCGSENEDDEDLFQLGTRDLAELEKENSRFRSMSDFYDSIPDYNDLHHLSETEFYSRLERLKIHQQELMNLVEEGIEAPLTQIKVEPVPQSQIRASERENNNQSADDEDNNSILSLDYSNRGRVTSRPTSSFLKVRKPKSVRISSGTTNFSEMYNELLDENLRINMTTTRSKSASPRRSTRSLTIPKPFKMTQKEEEKKMVDDLASSKNYFSTISINFDEAVTRRPKIKPFKANPVPLTSRIPLYEHIKEDHRRKSHLAKLNSAIELQAQIKPFKFNEKPSSSRCLSRTASTPNLSSDPKAFKATSCPKNLFSNYFYNKKWEEECLRALTRKIRAEEMLKISSLPPSMAKRTQSYCPDYDVAAKSMLKGRRKKRKAKKAKPFDFKEKDLRSSSCSKRSTTHRIPSTSSIATSSCGSTPIPTSYPVNRPNLAATLRVQSARQKVRELAKPKSLVPENKLTTVRRPMGCDGKDGWGVRKAPAWRSMTYDPSNMEDIAYRLATRRAEQRLRQEEHAISMELMKQRVRAAPLLLEGPTQWGPKVGALSHHCRSAEVNTKAASSRRRGGNSSKLSFYSVDTKE